MLSIRSYMYTVPASLVVTKTVGLNGLHNTEVRYSLLPGSKTATGRCVCTSYMRTVPSVEQVRNRRLIKGEQEVPVTGPRCFS